MRVPYQPCRAVNTRPDPYSQTARDAARKPLMAARRVGFPRLLGGVRNRLTMDPHRRRGPCCRGEAGNPITISPYREFWGHVYLTVHPPGTRLRGRVTDPAIPEASNKAEFRGHVTDPAIPEAYKAEFRGHVTDPAIPEASNKGSVIISSAGVARGADDAADGGEVDAERSAMRW